MRADRYFAGAQQKRLAELMQSWRVARDQGKAFPSEELAELEQLINAELIASAQRAAALLGDMQS